MNTKFNSTIFYNLIFKIINNIKKQKIFESLDEDFIKDKMKKILRLFLNTFLIKNNQLLFNIITTLKWSFYKNKKNIIILYFKSYKDLNMFLTIKNELLKFICNKFNNPYMDIKIDYKDINHNFNSNFLIFNQKNYYIIYLKEKLCLIDIKL